MNITNTSMNINTKVNNINRNNSRNVTPRSVNRPYTRHLKNDVTSSGGQVATF